MALSLLTDKIDLGMPPVIELVQKHLPVILNLLTHPPVRKSLLALRSLIFLPHSLVLVCACGLQKPTELKTQFGALNPPFGETRMKAVELLLVRLTFHGYFIATTGCCLCFFHLLSDSN